MGILLDAGMSSPSVIDFDFLFLLLLILSTFGFGRHLPVEAIIINYMS